MLPKPDVIDKRTLHVFSNKIIPPETLKKIEDIFAESQCPNESMFNSIPEFVAYVADVIIIGDSGSYHATVQV